MRRQKRDKVISPFKDFHNSFQFGISKQLKQTDRNPARRWSSFGEGFTDLCVNQNSEKHSKSVGKDVKSSKRKLSEILQRENLQKEIETEQSEEINWQSSSDEENEQISPSPRETTGFPAKGDNSFSRKVRRTLYNKKPISGCAEPVEITESDVESKAHRLSPVKCDSPSSKVDADPISSFNSDDEQFQLGASQQQQHTVIWLCLQRKGQNGTEKEKKMNEESREQHLLKERERQRKRYIPVADRTEREQRKIRRTWKKNQRTLRASRKNSTNNQDPYSPPPTPEPGPVRTNSHRLLQNRAKAYRDLKHLKYKLKQEKSKVEKYKKRYVREKAKNNNLRNSPSLKTTEQLKKIRNVPTSVRRTLLFHNVMMAGLRQKYQSTSNVRQKQMIYKIACGSILRKYRMMNTARRVLGFCPKKRLLIQNDKFSDLSRKRRSDAVDEGSKLAVLAFFERDDNSRIKPGKKDTITRRKVKKQKRLLSDSIKNLHFKFLSENPNMKISYTLFCSLRPFWVVQPKLSDRDTCLCKRHDNMQLMADKLHRERVFATNNLSELYKHLVCETNNQKCMYGSCTECANKRLPPLDTDLVNNEVTYQQWVNRQEERSKWTAGGEEKINVKVTVKETISCRISDLYDKFETELKPRFTTHAFNINHQFRSIKQLRESLQIDDVVLHIDFSENYGCKSHSEIQSVHFGASHNQATLHTGVAYTSTETIPFCAISKSTRHDPSAIWAHLTPTLKKLKQEKNVCKVHFVSDGPTTQYRNKNNFFFASLIPYELGYTSVTWNFLEAGHGKGAADGIGGTLKRMADQFVSAGKDIPDAEALYQMLAPSSSIQLSLIEEDEVRQMDGRIPEDLLPIPSTMKIHQIISQDISEQSSSGELHQKESQKNHGNKLKASDWLKNVQWEDGCITPTKNPPQEQEADAADSAKKKKKYARGSMADQLSRLQSREKSAMRVWYHQSREITSSHPSPSPTESSKSLTVKVVSLDMSCSLLIVTCHTLHSHGIVTSTHSPIFKVYLPVGSRMLPKVTVGMTLQLLPPWQTLQLPGQDGPSREILLCSYYTVLNTPPTHCAIDGLKSQTSTYTSGWKCPCTQDIQMDLLKCPANRIPCRGNLEVMNSKRGTELTAESNGPPVNSTLHTEVASQITGPSLSDSILHCVEKVGHSTTKEFSFEARIHRVFNKTVNGTSEISLSILVEDSHGVFAMVTIDQDSHHLGNWKELLKGDGLSVRLTGVSLQNRTHRDRDPLLFTVMDSIWKGSIQGRQPVEFSMEDSSSQSESVARSSPGFCYQLKAYPGRSDFRLLSPSSQGSEVNYQQLHDIINPQVMSGGCPEDSRVNILCKVIYLDKIQKCKQTIHFNNEKVSIVLYITDQSLVSNSLSSTHDNLPSQSHSYSCESPAHIPPLYMMKCCQLSDINIKPHDILCIRDVYKHRGQLFADEYSQGFIPDNRTAESLYPSDSVLDRYTSLKNIQFTVESSTKGWAVGCIVSLHGVISGVNEDECYTWPECDHCGNDHLNTVPNTGKLKCLDCDMIVESPVNRIKMEVYVNSPHLTSDVLQIQLLQKTVESLLPTSELDEEYDISCVLGVSLGPLCCILREKTPTEKDDCRVIFKFEEVAVT